MHPPTVRSIFSHFQNLNLLILLEDLRAGHTAQGAWIQGDLLCPVAHGMPSGRLVADLQYLGQAAECDGGCDYAARHLGAAPRRVLQFVELWDGDALTPEHLLKHLEAIWEERLADAEAVQSVLVPAPTAARRFAPFNAL